MTDSIRIAASQPTRRQVIMATGSALAAQIMGFGPATAQAQTAAPAGRLTTMKIISPYPAGGGTDGFARAIGLKLTDAFKIPVVIDNRGGANGTVGAAVAAKSPPDGGTILIVAAGYAAGQSLYKNLPYDQTKDLQAIGQLVSGPLVLVVHPTIPAKTVKEFIEYIKARPNEVAYASSGIGSLPHLSAELLCAQAGLKMTHVPYKGPAVAVADVLSGRVPVYFNAIFASLPHVKSGALRALGVTTLQRTPMAPDIPTLHESGLPGFDMTNWYGLLVPAKTPPAMIARLNEVVNEAMASTELKDLAATSGMVVATGSAKQFDDFIKRESDKFEKLTKNLGLKME